MVCRWQPDEPYAVQLLALRDELRSRTFDPPAAWFGQPSVIGGRDRSAGGTWCASNVSSGVTAVVLNRPERRVAEPGAPSRGVLPLLALRHGARWPTELTGLHGMAGFNLVLVSGTSLRWWSFDGSKLVDAELEPGTYRFTPQGLADPDDRFVGGEARTEHLMAGTVADVWPDWLSVVDKVASSPDRTELIVRKPFGDDSYETVFGQFILTRPGFLRLDYLDNPADGTDRPWTSKHWGEPG